MNRDDPATCLNPDPEQDPANRLLWGVWSKGERYEERAGMEGVLISSKLHDVERVAEIHGVAVDCEFLTRWNVLETAKKIAEAKSRKKAAR